VRNFIWSGKATNARAKVKWETLVLLTSQGGLGIIDPKTQSEAVLAKLLIRGLEPRGEPWKELLRHKANQVMLSVHGLGPVTSIGYLQPRSSRGLRPLCGRASSVLG
jgi:hypothetical protein